jgi:hypothetical protein
MKNSLTALFLLTTLFAFCQRNSKNDFEKENFFRVGFNGGININRISGKSFDEEFSFDYGVRGFLQFNFSHKFGLQPEVGFVQSSSTQSNDFSDIYDDIALGGDQVKKAKLDYLKIGTLLNYNLGVTQRIKLQFGPQMGMLLSEKVDSLKTSQSIFKNGDFSLAAGIMFQLPLVHFGARFEQGLTNVNDIDNRDTWRSQAFQIFAGITF